MVYSLASFGATLAALTLTAHATTTTSSSSSTGPVVHVDLDTTYQVYDGIGVSEAFQRSRILYGLDGLSKKSQTLLLDLLFSNSTGAGFNILRNGIGSSPSDPWDHMESICPVAPATNSSKLNFISPVHHDEEQIWLAKQFLARDGKLIYADAWSADGYMKTDDSTNYGGYICGVSNTSCTTGDWRQAYADKLVKYIQIYANQGINIDYLGFLNEPDQNTSYASMGSSGQQAVDFLTVLRPTLLAANLDTKVACCDGSGWEQNAERIDEIVASGNEDLIDLVTAHGYSSYPSAPYNVTKKTWITEWSTFDDWNPDWYTDGGQSDGITWAYNIQSGFSVSNVSAFFYWWGAANNTDNEPLIQTFNDTFSVSKRLWAYAHWGRLVTPGAYRVGTSISGINASSLNVTAFANPDGSVAVQVLNTADYAETVSLKGAMGTVKASVTTWLTDSYNNFTENAPVSTDKGMIVAEIPARSFLSFFVSATK